MNKKSETETRSIPTDQELVRLTLAGQSAGFAGLVQRYQHRIMGLVRNYSRNMEDVRDLTQDIFLAMFRSLSRFDPERPFLNWFLRIATHHCYQYLREREKAILSEVPETLETDPLVFHVREEIRAQARAAFFQLEEDHKLVVWLYYFLDRSCREIADILEISVHLVKIRLFRARKLLGQKLREQQALENPDQPEKLQRIP